MSENNTNIVETADDNLDLFNDLFHGKEPEPKKEEEQKPVDDAQETIEDDADLADEENDNEQAKEEDTPKPKKNRTQERIEQLLEKERKANERANALEARLKQLEEGQIKADPTPAAKEDKAPHWTDKNEDGSDKYPLGQFDPDFNADHVKFMVAKQLEEARAAEQEARNKAEAQSEAERARNELTESWNSKLEPAKERYPDFLEKGDNLVETFAGIDQVYGEYLTATLMQMEFGPDVLYYLANNVDEAKRIVGLGPAMATVALGRIEDKFASADEDKQKARPKVSDAPAPPPANKGTARSMPEVAPDTDDLDAFDAMFHRRKA